MLSRGTELFSKLRANAVKWKIFLSLMFLNWIVDISAQITSQRMSFALIQSILIQQIFLRGLNREIISRYL